MAKFIVETKGLHKGAFEVEAVDIYNALSGVFDGVLISVEAAQQSVQTDDYWRCAKCQEYNPSNQGFCSGCGKTRRR